MPMNGSGLRILMPTRRSARSRAWSSTSLISDHDIGDSIPGMTSCTFAEVHTVSGCVFVSNSDTHSRGVGSPLGFAL